MPSLPDSALLCFVLFSFVLLCFALLVWLSLAWLDFAQLARGFGQWIVGNGRNVI